MAELDEVSFESTSGAGDGTSCPLGDNLQFYACNTSKSQFRGCCSLDPCDGTECPDPPEWQHPTEHLSDQSSATDAAVKTTANVGPAVSADPDPSPTGDDDDLTTTIRGTKHETSTAKITVTTTNRGVSSVPTFLTVIPIEKTTTHTISSMTSSTVEPIDSSQTTPAVSSATNSPTGSTDGGGLAPFPIPASSSEAGVAPSPAPSLPSEEGAASLPTQTIVGIAVGGGAGGLIAAALLFLFIRRCRHSKRTSSVRAASAPKYDDDTFMGTGTSLSQPTALTEPASRANRGEDVFAPFGGRAYSQRLPNPLFSNPPVAQTGPRGASTRSRVSAADTHLNSSPSMASSPQSAFISRADDNAIGEEMPEPGSPRSGPGATPAVAKEITMVRPDSQPRYIELESPGDNGVSPQAQAAPTELPGSMPAARPDSGSSLPQSPISPVNKFHDARSRLSRMAMSHPSPLVPGFSGTQMNTQNQTEETTSSGQPGDAGAEQGPGFRPNLDLTTDERERNQDVTSWSKYQ